MPIAWVTFWKSTWGTRMTPADILEKQKNRSGCNSGGKEKMTLGNEAFTQSKR
jgi:hyaluronan synthase